MRRHGLGIRSSTLKRHLLLNKSSYKKLRNDFRSRWLPRKKTLTQRNQIEGNRRNEKKDTIYHFNRKLSLSYHRSYKIRKVYSVLFMASPKPPLLYALWAATPCQYWLLDWYSFQNHFFGYFSQPPPYPRKKKEKRGEQNPKKGVGCCYSFFFTVLTHCQLYRW
jgi:hypothetical protein